MIFTMAATSAYDEDEVYLFITAEPGEVIRIGDVISIPMNDHTFEEREITDMYRDWDKWRKGKGLFKEIKEGEWAQCIIHNIHSGRIHTISSIYDDEIMEGLVYTQEPILIDEYETLLFDLEHYNWDKGFAWPKEVLDNSECDLALALDIFYQADGYAFLQNQLNEDEEWLFFLKSLRNRIINGEYQFKDHHFRIPLTRVRRYKLKKAGVQDIFLEDI